MRTALSILLAAACGGTGIDLDIYVPDGAKVDRVELWVAYEHCHDCPNGIAWTAGARASGDIFYLHDEKVVKAESQADRWVLHLDAEPEFSEPYSIAIVGYDGAQVSAVRVLRDVFIPTSTVAIWRTTLHPAAAATTDLDTAPVDPSLEHRAHVWARVPTADLADPTGCLVYQEWDGSTWGTEYFVPKSDPDCDGVPPELECSDFWFQYRPSVATCVSDRLQLESTCVLGRSSCADGVSNDASCYGDAQRVTTCLPDAYCERCGDELPADTCIAGATESAHSSGALAHYDCVYDVPSTGAPCPDQHVQLQLPYVSSFCGQVGMHYLASPFSDEKTELVFGSPGSQVKFKAALRGLTSEPCLVDIFWLGGTKDAFKDGVTFLLSVPYDNGKRAYYPVWVAPMGSTVSCTAAPNPPVCMYKGPVDDGFANCAR
jgi:hypothetical protein